MKKGEGLSVGTAVFYTLNGYIKNTILGHLVKSSFEKQKGRTYDANFFYCRFLVECIRSYFSFSGSSCSVIDSSYLFVFVFLFGPGQQPPGKEEKMRPPTKTIKKSRKENITSNTFFFRITFFKEAFIRNVIIILCININSIINNNSGRLQQLVLFFKILSGTRKNFIEIYGQFGPPPSKKFDSPGLA